MRLDSLDDGAEADQLAEPPAAELRHRQPLAVEVVYSLHLGVERVGNVDDLAAVPREARLDVLADEVLRRGGVAPVVAVDDVVGAKLGDDVVVHHVLLYDNAGDAFQRPRGGEAFLECARREAVVAYHRLVRENANRHLA